MRYVAFLKGMNLGNRRITNDELCACFSSMGFTGVSAFLASGNVIFTTSSARKKLEAAIARGLERQLGYGVDTFVRSSDEVALVAAQDLFPGGAGKLQVAFLTVAPDPAATRAALAYSSDDDRLTIAGSELYWKPKGGLSESKLDLKGIAKVLGLMTIRTHGTVTRLHAKLTSSQAG